MMSMMSSPPRCRQLVTVSKNSLWTDSNTVQQRCSWVQQHQRMTPKFLVSLQNGPARFIGSSSRMERPRSTLEPVPQKNSRSNIIPSHVQYPTPATTESLSDSRPGPWLRLFRSPYPRQSSRRTSSLRTFQESRMSTTFASRMRRSISRNAALPSS